MRGSNEQKQEEEKKQDNRPIDIIQVRNKIEKYLNFIILLL